MPKCAVPFQSVDSVEEKGRLEGKSIKALDIGCGVAKTPGAIGMDRSPGTQADVIHDLEDIPYPFPDDTFDLIIASHVMSNVDDVPAVMAELHRIGRNGAIVKIKVPHFTCTDAYGDVTHRHTFNLLAFHHCFDRKGSHRWYTRKGFEVTQHLRFNRVWRFLGIEALANRKPAFYESFICHLFPASDILIEVRVLK